MTFLLGKGVEGVNDTVMAEVGECVMYCIGKVVAEKEGFVI